MLTWGVVVALAIGVYCQRLVGAMALDPARLGARAQAVVNHIPIAILSAVIALQTLSSNGELTGDARIFGIGTAVLLASRKAPMFVTVVAAAAVTAIVRTLA